MTDREAFEKWALQEGIDFLFDRLDDGRYLHRDTHRAWVAWQAACKYKDERLKRGSLSNAIKNRLLTVD